MASVMSFSLPGCFIDFFHFGFDFDLALVNSKNL